MRTGLCEIHLFNDKQIMHNRVFNFYIKLKDAGREQDSGETERERERESMRDSVLLKNER
jgi:hypothetical protein